MSFGTLIENEVHKINEYAKIWLIELGSIIVGSQDMRLQTKDTEKDPSPHYIKNLYIQIIVWHLRLTVQEKVKHLVEKESQNT